MNDEGKKLMGTGPDAAAIAVALGLDPKRVRSIHFHMEAGEQAEISVCSYVRVGEGKALEEEFKRYHLAPIAPFKDVTTAGDGAHTPQKLADPVGKPAA